MPSQRRSPCGFDSSGFSIVELAIVIAIIGALAAIAIPSFSEAQLQAKKTEMLTNHEGINKAMIIAKQGHPDFMETEFAFWTTTWTPRRPAGLDKQQVAWEYPAAGVAATFPGYASRQEGEAWEALGYAPDGSVRCAYAFTIVDVPGIEVHLNQTLCDLDDDNIVLQKRTISVKDSSGEFELVDEIPGSFVY